MTYVSELMISFLVISFPCSIFLTILHLSLVCLPCNAEILTTCQSLDRRGKKDFVLEQEGESNAVTLYFLNTGFGLQQLAQRLR